MIIDHDSDGVSIDLDPAEAEDLVLYLAGHTKEQPNAVRALRGKLTEYVNTRPSYHQKVAEARGTPSRNGPDGKRLHTDERIAIGELVSLAKQWPQSLELFAHENVLWVLRVKDAAESWPLTLGDLKRIALASIETIRCKGNEVCSDGRETPVATR